MLMKLCGLSVFTVVLCLHGLAAADEKVGKGGYGGYGRNATGGAGHPTVEVRTLKELEAALKKGNAIILLKADIDLPKNIKGGGIVTNASNITLDGQGHTISGDNLPASTVKEGRGVGQMLTFSGGKNFIVKNIKLRNSNSGGNIRFSSGARDIVIDHISSTGCCNKGVAITNGARDATITHCFLGGNTRTIFCKYDNTTNITVDHCIICKLWMRAPMLTDVGAFDMRNNYIMDWKVLGTRIEGAKCNGNCMGNIYVVTPENKGRVQHTKAILYPIGTKVGKVYLGDNEFRNCSTVSAKSTVNSPLPSPAIVPAYTKDLAKLEKSLLSNTNGAGCMPRDGIDKAYLATKELLKAQGTPLRVKPLVNK